MGSEMRRLARPAVGTRGYSLIGLCVAAGLVLGCPGCGAIISSGPPSGQPVDVSLTLALAVTDADGTPLDALVTVIVYTYEGLDINQTVYEWHTSTSPEQQTVSCVGGDPDEEFTWEVNGFWADFQTVSVQQQDFWEIEVTVTKTGYRPKQENWTVFYEDVRDSGCYGMWWILRMQEVTP